MAKKRELRYKPEQDRFEASRFTEFKVKEVARTKEEAIKLYQEVIIVHFYDFYLKFEKWMSDLIKLHNDIMSVHQKLVECDKALNTPYEFQRIDHLIDTKINSILDMILIKKNEAVRMEAAAVAAKNAAHAATANMNQAMQQQQLQHQQHAAASVGGSGSANSSRLIGSYSPATPPQTICSNGSSRSNSIEQLRQFNTPVPAGATVVPIYNQQLSREDGNNNNLVQHQQHQQSGENYQLTHLINFKIAHQNVDFIMNGYDFYVSKN
jgi:hypothetical protein